MFWGDGNSSVMEIHFGHCLPNANEFPATLIPTVSLRHSHTLRLKCEDLPHLHSRIMSQCALRHAGLLSLESEEEEDVGNDDNVYDHDNDGGGGDDDNKEEDACPVPRKDRKTSQQKLQQHMGNIQDVHGIGKDARRCFVAMLKACGERKDLEKGSRIHAEVATKGLLETDIYIGNSLVSMYAKCGSLEKARYVFDALPARNLVSWSALIAGYAEHGHEQEALDCFDSMQLEGVFPNEVTYVSILKACSRIGAAERGCEIHALITRERMLERNLYVGNALVDMYAKCGLLAKAQEVFDKLPVHNVISWNALITGYALNGCGDDALKASKQMQGQGILPNKVTFLGSLKACGSIGAMDIGQELHTQISRQQSLNGDTFICNALIDMYAKCGSIAKAQEVFDKLLSRDLISWNSLIAGYTQHGYGEKALSCFTQMQIEGVSPNLVTLLCILKACATVGATGKSWDLHSEILMKGLSDRDLVIGNALIDMHAKCGLLAEAQEVFDKLPLRNTVSWNVIISGHAQYGESEMVFHTLDKMTYGGSEPDEVTFSSLLIACSHSGQVDKGQAYFKSMNRDSGIIPTLEHYTCMVDLFGRAGQLDEAVEMIKNMPFEADLVVWNTLLGVCRKWSNVQFGTMAFKNAVQLNKRDPEAYSSMFNIYLDVKRQEDAIGRKTYLNE